MKCTNPQKLFEQFPQLQEIADRLEKSEQAAQSVKEKIKNQSSEQPPAEGEKKKKGYAPPGAEHFIISRYRKAGIWKNTVYTSEFGKKPFEAAVDKCLNNYDPDAITVKIFPRTASRTKSQEYDIYFSQEAEREPEKNQFEEEMKNRLSVLEDKFSKAGEQPGSAMDMLTEVKLLRKENEFTLEKIKIVNDYEEKIKTLQEENNALTYDLEDAEEEVQELKEELGKLETTLGGIHSEYEKREKEKEENPLFTVAKQALAAGGEQALKSLLIKNSELLDGLNFTGDQKKKFLDKLKGNAIEALAEENKNGGASATDAPSGIDAEIKDKPEAQRKALKNIWDWLKQLSMDDFKIIFEINMGLSTKTGDVNKEVAEPILEQVRATKEKETAA